MHNVKNLVERQVSIHLYGCGGTGSHVLAGLASLAKGLEQLEHPGIHVSAYDPEVVEWKNVGRQAFVDSDVGLPKARVLVERINMYYRQRWNATRATAPTRSNADIIIACVDTKASRKDICGSSHKPTSYIIDCGNERSTGQVILGQWSEGLYNPYKEFPELITGEESKEPGCADQYAKQDMFINKIIGTLACDLVWSLFREQTITRRGMFIDLKKGIMNPVKC